MNPARYKLMLSYLPGMAAIVNSFQAPDVQRAVYDSLMDALNVRLDAEIPGAGATVPGKTRGAATTPLRSQIKHPALASDPDVIAAVDDIAHDLEEGDSIHAIAGHNSTLP